MEVTISFRFRQRMIPLDTDSPPRYDLPENWIEWGAEFKIESRAGIEPVPSVGQSTSADRRHLIIISPRAPIDTSQPATWEAYTILGEAHTIGGAYIVTDPVPEGLVILNGAQNPPARVYYVEGEEMSKVGLWEGIRKTFFWWL